MRISKSLRDLTNTAESLVYIEDLSDKKGFLQSINPLVKLIVTIFMISVSLLVPWLTYLAAMCVIPLVLAIISKIPLKDFLLRTTLIPAFAALITLPALFITPGTSIFNANLGLFNLTLTSEGFQHFAVFSLRVWFCVAILTVLTLSTGFTALMKLLSSLRVPSILIQLFSLTYRYLFVSIHEVQKVLLAKEARTYITRRTVNLEGLKHAGAFLASLFVRTYERSERVYMAMKSRGFEINNAERSSFQRLRWKDVVFAGSTMVIFALFITL
jgi:cobalt/nickel transport system permease protein